MYLGILQNGCSNVSFFSDYHYSTTAKTTPKPRRKDGSERMDGKGGKRRGGKYDVYYGRSSRTRIEPRYEVVVAHSISDQETAHNNYLDK